MDPFIAYDYNHYNALANDYYKVKKHYQWSNETTKLPLIYLPWLNKASKSMCSFLPQFLLRISSEYPHIQTGSSFPYTLFWGKVCYLFLNADAARCSWLSWFLCSDRKEKIWETAQRYPFPKTRSITHSDSRKRRHREPRRGIQNENWICSVQKLFVMRPNVEWKPTSQRATETKI